MKPQQCFLCGTTAADVTPGLVAWKQPIGKELFTSGPRCKDAAACRERVEAAGAEWDVRDPERSTEELIRG